MSPMMVWSIVLDYVKIHGIALSFFASIVGTAAAQNLDVPIFESGSDGQAASCFTSVVSGLKSGGDGFLAVRTGPGSQYRKIDEIHNGEVVTVYETKGKWFGIMYGESRGGCDFVGVGKRRPVSYTGKKGWVHSNWLKDLAG